MGGSSNHGSIGGSVSGLGGFHGHSHSVSLAQTPMSGGVNSSYQSQPTLKSKRASSRQGTAQSTKNSNALAQLQYLQGGSMANGQASIILNKRP